MMNFIRKSLSVTAVVGMLSAPSVFAAGFEKSQTWSAEAVGQASAVVGSVKGADALYFNPAGLQNTNGNEVSLNFSPTFSKFSGANAYQSAGTVDGKSGFSPVGGLLFSHKVNEQLGLGIGFYVSGGTKSEYDDLDYTAAGAGYANFHPTVKTDLAVTEAVLGAGYEIIPGLRLGAAWRVLMVNADFASVAGVPAAALVNTDVEDIKATRWNGFKLGAQYEAQDKSWGLGANFRSAVTFNAKGTATQLTHTAGGAETTAAKGDTWIANEFPMQIALGGFMKVSEIWKVSLQYDFTNYSADSALSVSVGVNSKIIQSWKNMHVGRLGFEYTGMKMPIRFGYAYTSQVTPEDYARSTFSSPGPGHAISAGSGMTFGDIDFNFAGEYSFASGDGHNDSSTLAAFPEVTSNSDFKTHAFVAHLSGSMHF